MSNLGQCDGAACVVSRRAWYFAGMASVSCLLFLSGCKGSSLPAVRGTVKVNGQIMPGATVVFYPKSGGGTVCYGEVGVDGTYTMMTGGTGGVTPGEYIVTVINRTAIGPDGASKPAVGPVVPARYMDPKTSDKFITVKADSNEPYDIDLQP